MSELIETARLLASGRSGRPSQTDLRRAISTAYFALFDALARFCADHVAGRTASARASGAWLRVYRSVEHRDAFAACKFLVGGGHEIENLAKTLMALYEKRQEADYNPQAAAPPAEEVLGWISRSERGIAELRALGSASRVLLVTEVLFRKRR